MSWCIFSSNFQKKIWTNFPKKYMDKFPKKYGQISKKIY